MPRRINREDDFGALIFLPIVLVLFYGFSKSITSNLDQIWQGEPVYELFKFDFASTLHSPEIFAPAPTSSNRNVQRLPNIILIHADALRADRLDAYKNPRNVTPFADTLIKNGATHFLYSFSNCSESICGFSSVLNSSFELHGASNGLLERLTSQGYFTNFIGTGDLNHAGLNTFFNNRVDNFLRADQSENYYKHDDRFILKTLHSFPKYQDIPTFFYLRLMSSHPLGSHRDKFKKYAPVPGSLFSIFFGKSSYEQLVNAHDNMAHQFDAYLADIFAIFGKKGFLDNTIVVIYGDHGDAMGEHEQIGHYQSLYNEEIHVPIIFWTSRNIKLNLKSNQFSTLMDIAPTLLYSLELNVPSNYLGYPLQILKNKKGALLNNKRGDRGLIFQQEGALFKIINKKNGETLVFDLINDFDEKIDLSKSRLDLAKKFDE
ncbi:sulfatase family protein [Alteromonas sp. BMJM2]|uniref:sulfatase family protein n=1 Tax=Alteromonas sp. BMJM2 TaxID=2954241 RepID=UPI0022B44B5B|nr:sulfatase-like hydrolase/transferase [Alteromonas sp. BMJM2]